MKKVEVVLSDRSRFVTEVENYNPMEILEMLNDPSGDRYVIIGDLIFERSQVVRVIPVREQ